MQNKHEGKVVSSDKKLAHVKSGSEATNKTSHPKKSTWDLVDAEELPGVEVSNSLEIKDDDGETYRYGVRFGGHEAYYNRKDDKDAHIRALRELSDKLTKGLAKELAKETQQLQEELKQARERNVKLKKILSAKGGD